MADSSVGSGSSESDRTPEDSNEVYRDYNEGRRPLHRARAEKALIDAKELLKKAPDDRKQQRELSKAIKYLERLADSFADEPLPGATAEILDTEEWLIYDDLRFQYALTGSMPALLDAFVLLVENGISPGGWILEPLAEAFGKILDDPDASHVARRLSLQGKTSGSSSPLKGYTRQLERFNINLEMRSLIEEFDVSRMNAANAVITKHGLRTHPKTLANQYQPRAAYPDLVRKLLDGHMEIVSGSKGWLTEDATREFLDSFPADAQKYLKSARPTKT